MAVAAFAAVIAVAPSAPAQTLSEQRDSLRDQVAAESQRIDATSAGLADAEAELATIDARVGRLMTEVRDAQDELILTRARLARLERRALTATKTLSGNLVDTYKAGSPDMVSVVLNADGFADLLDRLSYFRRVADQNARILDTVRETRADVAVQKTELESQRARYVELAESAMVDQQRASVIRNALLRRQAAQLRQRDGTQAELDDVQADIAEAVRAQEQAARQATSAVTATDAAPTPPVADASGAVGQVIAAANEIATLPYIYGGGHGSITSGYDCSGSLSYALAAAGLVSSPLNSTGFMSWGEPGVGEHITVYTNPGHAYMVVDGRRYDTSALSGGGTRWTSEMRSSAGFVARHPPGL